MTTPNVRCTCTGTCHPARRPALYALYAGAMAAGVNPVPIAGELRQDTGRVHGPFRVPGDTNDRDCYGSHYPRLGYDNVASARILAATDHIGRGTRNV